MKWLVTGGAGFIGSNFIRLLLRERPEDSVVNLDLLTYAGNLENLTDVAEDPRYRFVRGDIAEPSSWASEIGERPDIVTHFAAESHVDRSIEGATAFVRTNVLGTQAMLDWARKAGVPRYLQVSTDEVYGTLGLDDPGFTEHSPIAPNSPYAASKASADLLVRAAHETHKMHTVTTRCSNNYGPYQFPEKLLPLMILNALGHKDLPVYGDGRQVRDWIHVDDHSHAVLAAADSGKAGGIYNIGGAGGERENLEMVHRLLDLLDRPRSLIRHVEDRKGHDRRYAIDSSHALAELGWAPTIELEDGLRATVDWYLANSEWCERVRSGAYMEYYDSMYGERLSGASGGSAGGAADGDAA